MDKAKSSETGYSSNMLDFPANKEETTEYTVMKQLIVILMRVLTKLLYVKQYLCTPCAHYNVCAHCARINSVHASAHNDFSCDATIYAHTGTPMFSHAMPKFTAHAPICQPFPWTLCDSNFGHFKVTLLWIFSSTEPLWPIQSQC
jgi:hypothetical protein